MADSGRLDARQPSPGSSGLNGRSTSVSAAQTVSPPRQKGRFLIVEPPKLDEEEDLTESSASPGTSPATYENLTSPEIQSRFTKATQSPSKTSQAASNATSVARNGSDASFGSAPNSTNSAPRSGPARNQTSAPLSDSSSSTSSSHGPSATPFVIKNTEGALFDPAMAAAYGWHEDDSSASETSESSTTNSYTSSSTSRSRSSSARATSSSITHSAQPNLVTLLPPMSAYGSGQLPMRERERMRREWLTNILAHRNEQERVQVEKERAIVERKRQLELRAIEAAAQAQEAADALAAAVEAVARAQAQARALLIAREQISSLDPSLPVVSSATFVDAAGTRSANSVSVLQSSPSSPRSIPSPSQSRSATSITSPGSPTNTAKSSTAPLELDLTAANASRNANNSSPNAGAVSPKASAASSATPLPVLDLATYQAKRLSVEPSSQGLTTLPPPTPHGSDEQSSPPAISQPQPIQPSTSPRGETLTPPPYSVSTVDAEKRTGHRRSASDTFTLEARMQVRRDSGPPPPRPTNEHSPRSGSKSSSLGKHGTATASKKALEMTVWTEPSLSSSSLSEADSVSTNAADVVDLSNSGSSIQVHGAASPATPKRVRIQERPATDLKSRGRSASVSKRIGNFIGRIFDSKTAKDKEGHEKEKPSKKGKLRRSSSSMSSSSATQPHHGVGSVGEESLESSHSSTRGGASPPRSINSLASSHSSESVHRISSELALSSSSHSAAIAPSTSAPSAPSLLESPPSPSPPEITTTDTDIESLPELATSPVAIEVNEGSSSGAEASSPPTAPTGKSARPKPPVPPKPSVILRSQTLRPSTTTKREFGLEEAK